MSYYKLIPLILIKIINDFGYKLIKNNSVYYL